MKINDEGMTLRDYFAGQAIMGILACNREWDEVDALSYEIADAMIKARNKKKGGGDE